MRPARAAAGEGRAAAAIKKERAEEATQLLLTATRQPLLNPLLTSPPPLASSLGLTPPSLPPISSANLIPSLLLLLPNPPKLQRPNIFFSGASRFVYNRLEMRCAPPGSSTAGCPTSAPGRVVQCEARASPRLDCVSGSRP